MLPTQALNVKHQVISDFSASTFALAHPFSLPIPVTMFTLSCVDILATEADAYRN